jgi:alpha/beta superfamily hydrolase
MESMTKAGVKWTTCAPALQWMGQEFGLPLVFAGFSFGAAVGLRAACPHPNVAALISLGTPVAAVDEGSEYDFTFLQTCIRPKLFVSGMRDQYGPRPVLERVVKSVPEPKNLVLIEGADHFFAGRLFELRHTIEHWIKDTLPVHA